LATLQHVVASPAVEPVVAIPAVQFVVVRLAVEPVIAVAAEQGVIPIPAMERVIPTLAGYSVRAVGAGQAVVFPVVAVDLVDAATATTTTWLAATAFAHVMHSTNKVIPNPSE
jgi:hypothetical protein